jgi:hypothetical protein
VLGIKVLLRAGVCRPRENLARSITSLAQALTLTKTINDENDENGKKT